MIADKNEWPTRRHARDLRVHVIADKNEWPTRRHARDLRALDAAEQARQSIEEPVRNPLGERLAHLPLRLFAQV